ncbi:MAG: alpha-galactosidase [Clostridia bacterium]|nr:alpha-galactosidase [Clostridia bacterium]
MPILFHESKRCFHLTDGTSVSFVLQLAPDPAQGETLYHAYWGPALDDAAAEHLPALHNVHMASFDEGTHFPPFAYPTSGRGDFRPAALQAVGADGTSCVMLQYEGYEILPGKPKLQGLPAFYTESDNEADTLCIHMRDPQTALKVTIRYTVMQRLHVLTQSVLLENGGAETITLHNPASCCVTLPGAYDMLHLHGKWARERSVERAAPMHGVREIRSSRGASGHEHNPFAAFAAASTTEHNGPCYGLSLVYSGSHRLLADQNAYGYTRILGGVNECVWRLAAGESFQTPEMLLSFSQSGLNGLSQLLHTAIRTRLCRGIWRDQVRPILINNWEATYFKFNKEKLLAIAKRAAEAGMELFVLDDGWFGRRNNDKSSLGDWFVNEEKLSGGLKPLADSIHALGMQFGLWFEPEMISPDSDLYRANPDWCLHVPGRPRSTRRNQLVLDMSNPDVQDYVIASVTRVLESAPIDYVKWDMNRNFAETGSAALSPCRQGEVHHRYMLGLYRVLEEITTRFPHILFESCSGGGGRFDPGMLYYMPQTWTSDDTDAVERLFIQYGTSLAYPPCTMGAHVSAVPNHQVGRVTTLKMRGDAALMGAFGYELDLTALSDGEMAEIACQVARVKQFRSLTQKGRFTRLASPFEGRLAAWQFASEDRGELLVCIFRRYAEANAEHTYIRVMDVDENACYKDDEGRLWHGGVLKHVGILPVFGDSDAASMVMHLTRC